MSNDRIYAYDVNAGEYVYRIPGHQHGDGQVDSDEHPVWLACDGAEAEEACNGDVPDVRL